MTKKQELIDLLEEAKEAASTREQDNLTDEAINRAQVISYKYAIRLAEAIL